jgi:type IV pilus assembly protein PilY1
MRYLIEIKLEQRKAGFFLAVVMAALLVHVPVFSADTCSEGSGIPPFLSSGVAPNMLLIIDNSGSMLDMAYVDQDTDGTGPDKKDLCFDNNYDPTINYVGYFETDDWYVWKLGATPWTSSKNMVGDPWVATWEQGTAYTAGEIVYANGALYRAEISGAANDPTPRNGYNLNEDEGVDWLRVSQSNTVSTLPTSCTDDALVSYNDMVYVCKSNTWIRLEGGQFSKLDAADALSVCSSASGDKYSYAGELCITVTDEYIPAAPPLGDATIQTSMQAFAARGNYLNWASSSKFDIQKKILTGGKYNSDEKQLIGESRGCAGSGFVKQVPVTAAASTYYLVMRVRGANSEDITGSAPEDTNTDDITRLEIVGLSSTGFDITACQQAVETLQQNDIDQCLGSNNNVGVSQAALSIAVNICRQISVANPGLADVPNLATTVADKCENLFTNYGYTPSTMSPEDGGYVCYGIYDAFTYPNSTDRIGYLGRCWDAGTAVGCNPRAEVSSANGGCDRGTDPRCTYCADGTAVRCDNNTIYKNEDGYNYRCIDVKGNDSSKYYCKNDDDPSDWEILYVLDEDLDGDGNIDFAEDVDGDGKLDLTDEDIDGDGHLDVAEDIDGDGHLDVNEDLDGDGHLDINEDLNNDGLWSVGEIDVDGDGFLDTANEDLNGDGNLDVNEDLNGNGTWDPLEPDVDGDGVLDTFDEDLDGDGNLDVDEDLNNDGLWTDAEVDADGDGHLDVAEDIDGDGHLDVAEDLDGDGHLDVAEDLDGDGNLDVNEDIDGDGKLDLVNEDQNEDGILGQSNIFCQPGNAATGDWVPDWGSSSDFANDPNLECIGEAIIDFCGDLEVPEVIDPSDQATTTSDYWNVPAMLIDSGALSQMGLAKPLAVMKILIQYDLPLQQINEAHAVERPDGPRGILFDAAPDLRIGAMSFRDNGSKTECDALAATCTETSGQFDVCIADQSSPACLECVASRSIIKHCPTDNHDGAQVITQINQGMYTTDPNNTPADDSDDLEVWNHYVSLVTSINETKATSWTPLAEAIYSAIGYYGQNTAFRIDADDFSTEGENVAWPDPVKYWCQDNHILIITEGASTADTNNAVTSFVTKNGDPDTTDPATDGVCTDGLDGSTYLDDLTYFGQNATVTGTLASDSDLYIDLLETGKTDLLYAKQPITTHIVTTGTLRTDGTGECIPSTLMTNAASNGGTNLYSGEDPAQLEANLRQALNDILNRASAGSAASVISSSRSGEGAAYQAVFWPKTSRGLGDVDPLSWIGDVHSMYVDSQGYLWDDYSGGIASTENSKGRKWSEDTNGNGRLDSGENLNENDCLDGDRRMFFYYDSINAPKGTKICFNDSVLDNHAAPVCDASLTKYCGKDDFVEPIEIRGFKEYLWSSNGTLEDIDDANITINREVDSITGKWDFNTSFPKRYIFTWNDLDNDGIVDSDPLSPNTDEIIQLVANDTSTTDWDAKVATHHSIYSDFRVADLNEMNHLVDWLRGDDSYWEVDETVTGTVGVLDPAEDINGNGIRDYVYRCRRFPNCEVITDANNPSGRTQPNHADNPVWRLGDVIHSTPKLVAQPSEGFHTIYRDKTYSSFIKKYRFRRHVVYFGANDGMLHAVNAGFYDEDKHQFYTNQTRNSLTGVITRDNSGSALGHELWAYIPYNLQPHLKCMTDPDYVHKYYVDHEPRIFDVQIWDEEAACATSVYDDDCIHPKGWGTILVGSMRFGGSPVDASSEADWDSGDNREFVSSFFILDITDPERPPTLLGEMTKTSDTTTVDGNAYDFTDLGYTTSMPTMVVMRNADGADADSYPDTTWYLVMGKGPTTLKGENYEAGKLAILPLSRLVGNSKSAFRFVDAPPSTGTYTGATGDAGDTIAITGGNDFVTIPTTFTGDLITVDTDIEQAATTDGAMYKSDAVYFGTVDGSTFSNGSTFTNPTSDPDYTEWSKNGSLWRLVTKKVVSDAEVTTTPADWYLSKLINSLGPITAAPTIGWDGDNIWIYVGTGRFFADEDKTDNRNQYYYGIKEPRDSACNFTWGTIDWLDINNTVPFDVDPTRPAAVMQRRGLLRTDNVKAIFRGFYGFSDSADAIFFCDTTAAHGRSEPGGSADTCDMSDLTSILSADLAVDGATFDLSRTYYRYDDLIEYIAGEPRTDTTTCPDSNTTIGLDGWYRIFHNPRERNVGQATLLGGLLTFTTYQPSANTCTPEGKSFLYGLHYQTGTAWYQNIFGLSTYNNDVTIVNEIFDLGEGLSTTPSLHVGDTGEHDAKAFVQTSTGEIVEIEQEDLPIQPPKSGKQEWNDSCD